MLDLLKNGNKYVHSETASPRSQVFLYFIMDKEQKRRQNERKFEAWDELLDGKRRYYYEVEGRHGWLARYVKEVDMSERTIKFYQEIYDDDGRLVEIHEKYPVNKGRVRVKGARR